MNHSSLQQLKILLQGFGPVRPEAWEQIKSCITEIHLKAHQNFIRDIGSLAYVVEGCLKEYNPWKRTRPSIINFLPAGQFIVTRKHNQFNFIKAYDDCTVYQISRADLKVLYHAFNELEQVHDGVCESYDESIAFRHLLHDEYDAKRRVAEFKKHFGKNLNYMSKKDMASFVDIEYTYFLGFYNDKA